MARAGATWIIVAVAAVGHVDPGHSAAAGANGLVVQSIIGAPVAGYAVGGNARSMTGIASGDGHYVAFASDADNFVPNGGDQDASTDVFVRDNWAGTLTRISGRKANGTETDDDSFMPSMSSNARYVAFVSNSDGITADDSNQGGDAYVYDRVAQTYTRASVADGAAGGDGQNDGVDYTTAAAISANGNMVAFTTDDGLSSGDTNSDYDVYERDLVNKRTYRLSGPANGGGAVLPNEAPAITPDGCKVAFSSTATDIDTAHDAGTASDVFLRDMCTTVSGRHPVARVSVTPSGGVSACAVLVCNENPAVNNGSGLSAPGRFVTWASKATDRVTPTPPGVDGTHYEIFVRDLASGTTTLVSRIAGSVNGAAGNGDSVAPTISPDGCTVAFSTQVASRGWCKRRGSQAPRVT